MELVADEFEMPEFTDTAPPPYKFEVQDTIARVNDHATEYGRRAVQTLLLEGEQKGYIVATG